MVDILEAPHNNITPFAHHCLSRYIASILEGKSAVNTTEINLLGKSDMADAMIVTTGNSTTHVGALAHYAARAFKQAGVEVFSITGTPENRWVLVDTAEVMVHIFLKDERELYNLEKMWATDFNPPPSPNILH